MEVSRFRTKVSSFGHLDGINTQLVDANSLSDDSHFKQGILNSLFEFFLAELDLFYRGSLADCPRYGHSMPKLGAMRAQTRGIDCPGYEPYRKWLREQK